MKSITALLAASATALLLATPALAGTCPALMAEIDRKLQAAVHELDDEAIARVIELRTEGEAKHQTGRHAESVKTLEKALAIIDEG